MLKKSQRLNLTQNFSWVASGTRIETDLYKVFVRTGTNTQPLIGISLAKKVFPLSVDRNRVKRLISTAISPLYSQLLPQINLVIMPKSSLLGKSPETIQKQLQEDLGRYLG